MPPESQLFGANRTVLYLENAVDALKSLDGSRRDRITGAIEQFLDSPPGAFKKHPREYVGQIADRGSNTRAFATWCQSDSINIELCVVQIIYRKSNEDRFWDAIQQYNEEGEAFVDGISGMGSAEYEGYIEEARSEPDLRVVQ